MFFMHAQSLQEMGMVCPAGLMTLAGQELARVHFLEWGRGRILCRVPMVLLTRGNDYSPVFWLGHRMLHLCVFQSTCGMLSLLLERLPQWKACIQNMELRLEGVLPSPPLQQPWPWCSFDF